LQKLLFKSKPEKMTEQDLSAIRAAMSQLQSDAAHLISISEN